MTPTFGHRQTAVLLLIQLRLQLLLLRLLWLLLVLNFFGPPPPIFEPKPGEFKGLEKSSLAEAARTIRMIVEAVVAVAVAVMLLLVVVLQVAVVPVRLCKNAKCNCCTTSKSTLILQVARAIFAKTEFKHKPKMYALLHVSPRKSDFQLFANRLIPKDH